jgi:uncharacterized membrane protein (UPF0182 family)
MRRNPLVLLLIGLGVVLLLGILGIFRSMLVDYWWFSSLGFGAAYRRIVFTQVWLWLLGFVLGAGAVISGFVVARRFAGPVPAGDQRWGQWTVPSSTLRKATAAFFWSGAGVVGLIGGSAALFLWRPVLMFLYRTPFGVEDPLFGNDIGFYVFTLPIVRFIPRVLLRLTWVSFGAAIVYYLAVGALRVTDLRRIPQRAFAHLTLTLGIVFVLIALGHFLDRYQYLRSSGGALFGAGYADVHARIPACWVMTFISLGTAAAFFALRSRRRLKLLAGALAAYVGCMVIFQGIYPAMLQSVRVAPNELELEKPYIANMIESTLAAYGLDKIEPAQYPVRQGLSHQDVIAEDDTIGNIRLWDWRPLQDTYRQIQGIRSYYEFNDVDVDRYDLAEGRTQVLLSVRELDARKLPESWVNQRLVYTHGYGFCMSPVSEHTEEGLPILTVRDIPPVAPEELPVEQPRVYFGEGTTGYVLANTQTEEFDYPVEEGNEYIHYDGKGGVRVGGVLRRMILAMEFGDVKIMLNRDINPDSRVLFRRLISERVAHVAPYLMLDSDPYPVIVDGRLVWIQDAYTRTVFYPYSQPVSLPDRRLGLNYLRNSVKVVVDAYDGTMTFYVVDEDDPLVRTYAKMFPSVYTPGEEMPAALRAHLRYPVDLFNIQVQRYSTFHMRDPQAFYNREDPWQVAYETYQGSDQRVESYYVTMRLPDGDAAEFIVMLPLTPRGKDNMIAWMAGRCDGDRYGELVCYLFPKGRLIDGPRQVESRIDQDPEISQQLTLWGQGGSSVIRGNLLVIPIAGGLLYVEPLYIQAQRSDAIPQLRRVIVAHEQKVAMAATLPGALRAVFGEEGLPAPSPDVAPAPGVLVPEGEPRAVLQEALDHYEAAQKALKDADWQEYGRRINAMKAALDRLDAMLGQQP